MLAALCLGTISALGQDKIEVGEYASLSGGNASFGQSSHNGIALAFDEINAAGGVLGKQIDLITRMTVPLPGTLDDCPQAHLPGSRHRHPRRDRFLKIPRGGPICQENKIR